jgi:aryl-alcohol dehydrogenase-like predicted oxidoreductase
VRYAPLGRSGIEVSVVSLGCNSFGMLIEEPQARAVVQEALESGITLFDTATSYGGGESERMLGNALRDRREEAVVATKFGDRLIDKSGKAHGAREEVINAVDASLARLGFDYVDVLYYHMHDGLTPLAETLGTMQEVVEAGKARAIAVSNFGVQQLQEAAGFGVTAVQNQYSLLERDDDADVLPLCRELDIAFVPYMPLANGLLTGKYDRGKPPPEGSRLERYVNWGVGAELLGDDRFDVVEGLEAFAAGHGHTLQELAIAALASEPAIPSVLVGAKTPEQVRSNAAAADWELDEETRAAVPGATSLGLNIGFRTVRG